MRKLMSTYRELLEQKHALDQQIAVARKAEAKQALDAVHTLIAEFGFTAQQVFPWKPATKKVEAKYRDPKTGASWSGRGRAPKWIEGKDRAEFLV
jgi:DNA-binding protein H-NS